MAAVTVAQVARTPVQVLALVVEVLVATPAMVVTAALLGPTAALPQQQAPAAVVVVLAVLLEVLAVAVAASDSMDKVLMVRLASTALRQTTNPLAVEAAHMAAMARFQTLAAHTAQPLEAVVWPELGRPYPEAHTLAV
jgi:hypothetical protein